MTHDPVYIERVSSNKTEGLFVVFALSFFVLFAGLGQSAASGVWSIAAFGLFAFFLFYALNYRTLIIQLSEDALQLQFGIFKWTIPFENIITCYVDPTSLWRIGGAGIHFTWLDGRYRAMFNFLEHPRLVVMLKRKKGPVQDIAFSTRRPEKVMGLVHSTGWGKETG